MEQQAYSPEAAKAYIINCFTQQGDFLLFGEATLAEMVAAVIDEDAAFIEQSGAADGEVYDDDAAFERLFARMQARFPAHKVYMMRLVEDYLDYNEQYLDSIGAIEWE